MLRAALGKAATIVLDGQRVSPDRTLAEGYTFKFPTLDAALFDLLS
jgi:NAD dependent epimerase/dehydratase family enzyme